MSTLKVSALQHPSSASANITLNADGTINASGAGKVLQVVSATKTDTQTIANPGSGNTVAITGLSVSITPSSASNKVMVFAQVVMTSDGGFGNGGHILLKRAGTDICVGDAAGSRVRRTTSGGELDSYAPGSSSILFLDSPATTSSIAYTVEAGIVNGTQTFYINRSRSDTDNANFGRYTSTITAMEIGA